MSFEDCEEQRIAESRILFIPPPSEKGSSIQNSGVRVVIALGKPVGSYPGTCKVFMDGFRKPVNIHGMDRFHALCCAIKFLRDRMQDLENRGWQFEDWFDPDETIGRQQPEEECTNDCEQEEEEEEENNEEFPFSLKHLFGGL